MLGFDVPEIDREFVTKRLETDYNCIPVYLSAEVAERYYNGFSNSILWPLFHCTLHNPSPMRSPNPDVFTPQIIPERCHLTRQIG